MATLSEIQLQVLHVQLHQTAWKDLEQTSEDAKEYMVYLKIKRGEMAQRFANSLDKPATRARAKAKASGPLTPIPMTEGEQMLMNFQMGVLDHQQSLVDKLEVKKMEMRLRMENMVAEMEPRFSRD